MCCLSHWFCLWMGIWKLCALKIETYLNLLRHFKVGIFPNLLWVECNITCYWRLWAVFNVLHRTLEYVKEVPQWDFFHKTVHVVVDVHDDEQVMYKYVNAHSTMNWIGAKFIICHKFGRTTFDQYDYFGLFYCSSTMLHTTSDDAII